MTSAALGVAALSTNGCTSGGGSGDAASDSPIMKKDSGGDGGNICPAAPVSCELCDVSGYTVVQMGAPTMTLNACTPAQLQSFVTACFSTGATQATCNTWQQQDSGACFQCLNPVSGYWGPFLCPPSSSCLDNSPGCIDLVLGSSAIALEKNKGGPGSCGDALNDDWGCQRYACVGCTATADFQACANDTIGTTGQCKAYDDLVVAPTGPCAVLAGDAAPPALSNCFPQTDADNVNFVNVFCGTGP